MIDLTKKYVIIEFTVIDTRYSSIMCNNKRIKEIAPIIIEVCSVEIENSEIIRHYSTFVGIKGYDARKLSFEFDCPEFNGITASRLIGAPALLTVVKNIYKHSRNSTIVVRGTPKTNDPFSIFRNYAKKLGFDFDNKIVRMSDFLVSSEQDRTWIDEFIDNDIDLGRNDPLGWALAFAQLFIKKAKSLDDISSYKMKRFHIKRTI